MIYTRIPMHCLIIGTGIDETDYSSWIKID
jgi:hypothetical protein